MHRRTRTRLNRQSNRSLLAPPIPGGRGAPLPDQVPISTTSRADAAQGEATHVAIASCPDVRSPPPPLTSSQALAFSKSTRHLRTQRPTIPFAPLQRAVPPCKIGGPSPPLQSAETSTSFVSHAAVSVLTSKARMPTTPGGPAGPGGPASPRGPCGPGGPASPFSPTMPGDPAGPVAPVSPRSPGGPGGPPSPFSPAGPIGPGGPLSPRGPTPPCGPGGPDSPLSPVIPWGPAGP
jgi:hypothetical protein